MTPDELEAIVGNLNADQLAELGAIFTARAAERRRTSLKPSLTLSEPEPLSDPLRHHAEQSRSVGIDDDLIGCAIAGDLLKLGHDAQEVARLISDAVIAWRPRTAEERLIAAAAELISYGLGPGTVRGAFTRSDGGGGPLLVEAGQLLFDQPLMLLFVLSGPLRAPAALQHEDEGKEHGDATEAHPEPVLPLGCRLVRLRLQLQELGSDLLQVGQLRLDLGLADDRQVLDGDRAASRDLDRLVQ